MRRLNSQEISNKTVSESIGVNVVSFKKACENIKDVYNVLASTNRGLIMRDWHCGTSHCLGGWAEVLFDKNYDPTIDYKTISAFKRYMAAHNTERVGYKYIWPVAHLFGDISATKGEIMKKLEDFLLSVDYEIQIS